MDGTVEWEAGGVLVGGGGDAGSSYISKGRSAGKCEHGRVSMSGALRSGSPKVA